MRHHVQVSKTVPYDNHTTSTQLPGMSHTSQAFFRTVPDKPNVNKENQNNSWSMVPYCIQSWLMLFDHGLGPHIVRGSFGQAFCTFPASGGLVTESSSLVGVCLRPNSKDFWVSHCLPHLEEFNGQESRRYSVCMFVSKLLVDDYIFIY